MDSAYNKQHRGIHFLDVARSVVREEENLSIFKHDFLSWNEVDHKMPFLASSLSCLSLSKRISFINSWLIPKLDEKGTNHVDGSREEEDKHKSLWLILVFEEFEMEKGWNEWILKTHQGGENEFEMKNSLKGLRHKKLAF